MVELRRLAATGSGTTLALELKTTEAVKNRHELKIDTCQLDRYLDQDAVGALGTDSAHEPLGVTVRSRVLGVLVIVMFSLRNTASKPAVNVVSRSRRRKRTTDPAAQIRGQVTGRLCNPLPRRMGGHPRMWAPAAAYFDHEQDVQAAQDDRVEVEESRRPAACWRGCVGMSARRCPHLVARGLAGGAQDPPDGRVAEPVAQAEESTGAREVLQRYKQSEQHSLRSGHDHAGSPKHQVTTCVTSFGMAQGTGSPRTSTGAVTPERDDDPSAQPVSACHRSTHQTASHWSGDSARCLFSAKSSLFRTCSGTTDNCQFCC